MTAPTWRIDVGDVLDRLRGMPDESVHCVVTSPPYWGLRDYGTASWDGGDPDCGHKDTDGVIHQAAARSSTLVGTTTTQEVAESSRRAKWVCVHCGARRVDQQLGLEPTPTEYLARMVEVFREARRVLRSDGTCWVNMGDSMAAGKMGRDDNSAVDRARMDAHGHGGGVKIQATGNNGKSRPVPTPEWELRDDLTDKELAYVLAELAKCKNL